MDSDARQSYACGTPYPRFILEFASAVDVSPPPQNRRSESRAALVIHSSEDTSACILVFELQHHFSRHKPASPRSQYMNKNQDHDSM
jgi:hypothetical protein